MFGGKNNFAGKSPGMACAPPEGAFGNFCFAVENSGKKGKPPSGDSKMGKPSFGSTDKGKTKGKKEDDGKAGGVDNKGMTMIQAKYLII